MKNQKKKSYLNVKGVNRLKDQIEIDLQVPAQMV